MRRPRELKQLARDAWQARWKRCRGFEAKEAILKTAIKNITKEESQFSESLIQPLTLLYSTPCIWRRGACGMPWN
jgi:hypothetical protein